MNGASIPLPSSLLRRMVTVSDQNIFWKSEIQNNIQKTTSGAVSKNSEK
jgi:hypothetical protein